jgi:hypothetical protein
MGRRRAREPLDAHFSALLWFVDLAAEIQAKLAFAGWSCRVVGGFFSGAHAVVSS